MKAIKIVLFFCVVALSSLGTLAAILFLLGYRPMIEVNARPDWEAIAAFAGAISALAAIAIPVAIFVLDRRMKRRADEAQEQLLNELKEFKDEFKSEYELKLRNLFSQLSEDGFIQTITEEEITKIVNDAFEIGEF